MAHTFPVENAARLEDADRFRFCSPEELVGLVGEGADRVADLGSGTGFYSREVAPHVGTLVGLDVQAGMHRLHREHGLGANVRLVTTEVDCLALADDSLDAAVSTMTFHEFCTPEGLAEIARVLRPGGRFANVDWSAEGPGEDGPSREDRQTAASAAELAREAGFEVERAEERVETFVLLARAPSA
ncbi:MAG: class I SAM-dependent methyltransferase [Halobacteriales archaeon]|nr:class I SAM-dependent methyltransferase [Halobacteriales archaeon]